MSGGGAGGCYYRPAGSLETMRRLSFLAAASRLRVHNSLHPLHARKPTPLALALASPDFATSCCCCCCCSAVSGDSYTRPNATFLVTGRWSRFHFRVDVLSHRRPAVRRRLERGRDGEGAVPTHRRHAGAAEPRVLKLLLLLSSYTSGRNSRLRVTFDLTAEG